jgi:biotin synthase
MMPNSVVRLSAGRQYMTDELQALCFLAGANSIFIGDVLLTTRNPQTARDAVLLDRLGIKSKLDDTAGIHPRPDAVALPQHDISSPG